MKVTHLVAGVLFILSSTSGFTLRREKRDVDFITGTCDSTQTRIVTRTIHTTNFTKCPISTLVSRYFEPFISECEHWTGVRPDHVASSNVFFCLEDPTTGGVYIKATVCCKGTLPPNTCVTCTSNDPDECDYEGVVVLCALDEMCETLISCDDSGQSTVYKSCVKYCHSSTSCSALTYLEYGETCADCCKTSLCNRGGRSLSCYPHCYCADLVQGNYHCDLDGNCICNDGCRGDRCEDCTATCDPNPCKNLGICQRTESGITCCCRPGYGGDYCEFKLPSCDRSICSDHGECVLDGEETQCICDPGYYGETCEQLPDTFSCPSSKNVYFTNPTPYIDQCSSVVQTPLSKTAELSACKYFMKSQYNTATLFEDGKDGHVTEVTDVSYNVCQDGDCGYAYYQIKTCCPSCFSNPCQNGGYCIQTEQNGTNEDYVCLCKFGFTGTYCEQRIQTCFVFGEPHYITYDGKFITHQGVCRYILTQYSGSLLTPFTVYLKNEYRSTDLTVSYPSYVEAELYGYNVRLERNNIVLVKSGNLTFQQISLNAIYTHFTVKTSGRFVRLETDFGLVVQYDGYNMLFVQLPDLYQSTLTGICNNMDGDATNDLVDCDGFLQNDDADGQTAYVESCLDKTLNQTNCTTDEEPCDTEPYASNEWCGYIMDQSGPLADCINLESVIYFEACKYDVCRDPSAKCPALESFVETCYQSGNCPDPDWREITGCPMNCPPNSTYVFSGTACQPTCEDPDANQDCNLPDTELCLCDPGLLLNDGECVLPEDCGCKDENNVRYEINETWDYNLETCDMKICLPCETCSPPATVQIVAITPIDGQWSEWGEWSDCSDGADTQTRVRACDNPCPLCDGLPCEGDYNETRLCEITTTKSAVSLMFTTLKSPTDPSDIDILPTSCSDVDIQKLCHECDKTRNPNMYIANPCGCDSYFQCIPNGYGGYDVIEMPCSECTCWNQTKLTCDYDTFKMNNNNISCQGTTASVEHVTQTGEFCTITSSQYTRHFRAIPDDPTHYIDIDAGGIKMPCPPGTVFDKTVCRCIIGGTPLEQREFMCLDFNDLSNPYLTTTGIWVSPSSSGLYPGVPGIEGYGLRFGGGNIEVPAFNNKEIRRLTLSLWYIRDNSSLDETQVLISNDDCLRYTLPTIQILSPSLTEVAADVRTSAASILQTLLSSVPNDSRWHHVAFTYDIDTQFVAFYLDGDQKQTAFALGPIPVSHCPLLIGSMYDDKFFYGVMDQVCFYDQAMSEGEVNNLYAIYSSNA